jgi:hypothetical protein
VSDAEREDFMQPQLIAGRYQVLRAIGRGGMGTVWLCRDEILGREVAIKQIGALPGESMTETKRAMREARSAAALNHPNAVAVYDVVDHDGLPWLVMEYVEGQTLADEILHEGRLSPQRVADIGAQLAGALARAHERRIVHRDIKPGNVLIDRAGRPKISDFGIARGHGDEQLTQIGFITGTPGYLSPELARGADPAPASDVWALGATLYAAVEGEPPYEPRSNPIAMLRMIATQRPRPMVHAGPLAPAIEAMMHEDPASRWDMATSARRLGGIARITTVIPRPDPAATSVMPGTLAPPDSTQPLQPTQRLTASSAGQQAPTSAQQMATQQAATQQAATQQAATQQAATQQAATQQAATKQNAGMPKATKTQPEPSSGQTLLASPPAASLQGAKPPAATASASPGVPVTERVPQAPTASSPGLPVQGSNGQGSNGQGSNALSSNGQGSGDPGDDEASFFGVRPRNRESRRRMAPLVLVAVAVLLAVLGTAYLLSQPDGQSGTSANQTTRSAPAKTPPSAQEPTTGAQAPQVPVSPAPEPASPSAQATASPSAPPPVAPAPSSPRAAQNFVRSYFANVTQDTSRTWDQLTPAMQRAAGSRAGYDSFWRSIKRVRINQTQVNASGTRVVVNLTYIGRRGSSTETKTFTVVNRNGRYLIDNERRGG